MLPPEIVEHCVDVCDKLHRLGFDAMIPFMEGISGDELELNTKRRSKQRITAKSKLTVARE